MPDASDISLRKLPPHDDDAEQYVLGACLHGIDPFAKALEAIQIEDFYKVRASIASPFSNNASIAEKTF